MTFDFTGAAWFIVDVSLRALAAAAAVAVVLRVVRMRAAAVIHAAWTAVLVVMLLMPALSAVVPELPVRLPIGAASPLALAPTLEGSPSSAVWPAAVAPDPGVRVLPSDTRAPEPAADRRTAFATTGASSRGLAALGLTLYAAVTVLLVARFAWGWSQAAGMIRRARRNGPLDVVAPAPVYESREVAVPMTVGPIRPVIVLPAGWRSWDPDTLAAVVAHESAHLRRRDTSIQCLAHVNRVIFWFNPLAWWLERKLAVTAEHACDEAAATAIAAPGRYAEILLEMADVVRRHHGRVIWQGVGVNGAGLLDRRIDRLLGADAFAAASRGRTIVAAVACLVALSTVIACRQRISAAPLREDPVLAKELADGEAATKRFAAARDMSAEQADVLEQRLAANPQDFEARQQLVIYYTQSGTVSWDKKVPGLRRHALWLIEHHPEHEIVAPSLSPQYDPEGFAAAKQLWETHLTRPDVSPYLVYRAANFFAPHDKPYTEALIRRGMAMDPESKALTARMPPDRGGYRWSSQLAYLYASALRGSERVAGTYNDLRTRTDQVDTAYTRQVRDTLSKSEDARLLASVGAQLTRPSPPTKDPALERAQAQFHALGLSYLERALKLDPNHVAAKTALVNLRVHDQLTDADRLANRAFEGHMTAEDITEYHKKDTDTGKRQREEARKNAEEALKLADAHPQDPAYSAAIMTAHHVLASEALRNGNRERAVEHLQASVKVPTSERLQYAAPISWLRPVNRLLKEGERERVAEFLEAFARLTIRDRERLLADAKAIREGRMTSSYQRMVAREGQ